MVLFVCFRQVKLNGELNIWNNFHTFGNSMQLLIRALTGENWTVSPFVPLSRRSMMKSALTCSHASAQLFWLFCFRPWPGCDVRYGDTTASLHVELCQRNFQWVRRRLREAASCPVQPAPSHLQPRRTICPACSFLGSMVL